MKEAKIYIEISLCFNFQLFFLFHEHVLIIVQTDNIELFGLPHIGLLRFTHRTTISQSDSL